MRHRFGTSNKFSQCNCDNCYRYYSNCRNSNCSSSGEKTEKALTQDFRFEQAETVRHFSQLYFALLEKHKGKITTEKLKEEELASAFWNLLSIEYYFYREGAIPNLIFASWVVDVAEFYGESSEVWKSHSEFLEKYKVLHSGMKGFFEEIYRFSTAGWEPELLHKQIKKHVYEWKDANNEDEIHTNSLKDLWS